jgi:hypothetical protein
MEGLVLMCGAVQEFLEFRGNFRWTKTDVSEEHIASIFRMEEISSAKTGKVLLSDSFKETVKSCFFDISANLPAQCTRAD